MLMFLSYPHYCLSPDVNGDTLSSPTPSGVPRSWQNDSEINISIPYPCTHNNIRHTEKHSKFIKYYIEKFSDVKTYLDTRGYGSNPELV